MERIRSQKVQDSKPFLDDHFLLWYVLVRVVTAISHMENFETFVFYCITEPRVPRVEKFERMESLSRKY